MLAGRFAAEVVIEGELAVDLRARHIECLRDHRNSRHRHVTERFLQRVQDHDRRAFKLVVLRDLQISIKLSHAAIRKRDQ
jgi:hypothetical protein